MRSLTRSPSGIPSSTTGQRCDSLGPTLMGFSQPSRLDPNSSPTTWATSLGVLFPYSASGEESSRSRFPEICRQVPPSRLRCRSQVFETSQRLIPLPTVLPFFRQETLMGFHPSGDYSFREAPIPRRYRNTLLTFLLRVGLSPFLGGESPRACWRFPRILRQHLFSSTGSSSSRKSIVSRRHG